jgi:hypothetical protein
MVVCPRAKSRARGVFDLTVREAVTCGYAHGDKSDMRDARGCARHARGCDLRLRASSRITRAIWQICSRKGVCAYVVAHPARVAATAVV